MLIFDLESNGLLEQLDRIHCLAIYDKVSDTIHLFDPDNKPIEQGIQMLQDADEICGHNILLFDIPAIKKVYPWFQPKGDVRDTLVQTRFVYSDIKLGDYARFRQGKLPGGLIGSHALKAWGYRLGEYKGDFAETTDWEIWTPEMSSYCVQDVKVTWKLVEHLDYRGVKKFLSKFLSFIPIVTARSTLEQPISISLG